MTTPDQTVTRQYILESLASKSVHANTKRKGSRISYIDGFWDGVIVAYRNLAVMSFGFTREEFEEEMRRVKYNV